MDTEKGRTTFSYTPVVGAFQTAITFTGIPTFAKQITVNFANLATGGSGLINIRLGTAADGIIATGYNSTSAYLTTPATFNQIYIDGGGFALFRNAGIDAITGTINIVLQGVSGSNYTWIASGNFYLTGLSAMVSTVASKVITSPVNQVSINMGGGGTFNAGSINVSYTD